MAISDDTAALVAAQLTVAWAFRNGVRPAASMSPANAEVAAEYVKFREAVREREITHHSVPR